MKKTQLKKAVVDAGGITKFAKEVGLSPSTISRLLTRDKMVPGLTTIVRIRRGLATYAIRPRHPQSPVDTKRTFLHDRMLEVAVDWERSVGPDERGRLPGFQEQMLDLALQVEQLELRGQGI